MYSNQFSYLPGIEEDRSFRKRPEIAPRPLKLLLQMPKNITVFLHLLRPLLAYS